MAGNANFPNRVLYQGDNLDFLRGMNSGTVHLIATDPPFNKNKDFHATPDSLADGGSFHDRWSWQNHLQPEWLSSISQDYPEVWKVIMAGKDVWGDDMGAFLCWLGVRLLEMRRILRDDGSIYLHIDHTAHAWVKCLMDAIFDRRNFRNEIVWGYTGPGSPGMRQFNRKHDTLLWYAKGKKWTFNRDAVRIPHKQLNTNAKGRVISAALTADERDKYLEKGKIPESWWPEFSPAGRIHTENTGYPTQKPLGLYERIIKASSNPGDVVLDPFCGCATTPVAAERQGRQWVGIDLWDGAYQQVVTRMNDNRQLLVDIPPTVTLSDTPPVRTDSGETAALHLATPTAGKRQRYPPPRMQHGRLLADVGAFCQGCGNDYGFDPRVLEVDHRQPKSDGGTDAYENLTLLCPPCNKEKRDRLTLTGLQEFNRRNGYLKAENEKNIKHGKAGGQGGRRAGRRR